MSLERNDPRLTTYALGEMSAEDRANFEATLAEDDAARQEVESIRQAAALLREELGQGVPSALSLEQHAELEKAAERRGQAPDDQESPPLEPTKGWAKPKRARVWLSAAALLGGGGLAAAAGVSLLVTRATSIEHIEPISRQAEEKEAASSLARVPAETATPSASRRLKPLSAPSLTSSRGLRAARGRRGTETPFAEPSWRAAPIAQDDAANNTEAYDHIAENRFIRVAEDPRSTFSIDVDTASYSLIRRHLTSGQLPPSGAVRLEEMVNYFHYEYPEPTADVPLRVHTEVSDAPWAKSHPLVRIGLKGMHVAPAARPKANLVFLIDVSGSMNEPSKLPLLKQGFAMLVRQLDASDRVAIVVYAGASGLVLPPTPGHRKTAILDALDRLEAGGSTNGGEGIRLAYDEARASFVPGGINRVILATDGDFNVGTTSQSELVDLIQAKAKGGVFLSVLGFGAGNYKDSTLEKLADKGNGNYAYLDSAAEANKVLAEQAASTLITIAKDVKIQIEFNPTRVAAFRLIGYENRVLGHQDFTDDRKDAGEIGADHTVTALYELIRAGQSVPGSGSMLRYQQPSKPSAAAASDELLTIKLRYKPPAESASRALEFQVRDQVRSFGEASSDHQFAAAVASFGMLLRNSEHKGTATYASVAKILERNAGNDPYRRELVTLVRTANGLSQ